jgi:hypothetical protein
MTFSIGQRVKLNRDVDVYPTVYAKAGEVGTVAEIDDERIMVRMDTHFPTLAEWHNQLEIWREWNEDALSPLSEQQDDARELAAAFRTLFKAGMKISEVLGRNDDLNNSVPTNWPLGMSADEWAHECLGIAEHYDAIANS